ncbi:hypothetical protein NA57DRAFT_61080 [Rhizodiscina lignyota]|uniref:Zn(2)-C6 fungal-type domain-containing protein n=1 Tax=Rhizodiscina lignyota TaxID=1504668 RepID=A0A9P4I2J6_9PEZI|nr:hypothetical protein NA57DRAFT_61080 [Rhizodiscina lignyota]
MPVEQQFKRSYQACVNCRKKKIKCEPSVNDDGNLGPCMRCKRERKHCVFDAKRRPANWDTGSPPRPVNVDQNVINELVSGNAREATENRVEFSQPTAANISGSTDASLDQPHPAEQSETALSPEQQQLVDRVLKTCITNQHDALDLLCDACTVPESNYGDTPESDTTLASNNSHAQDGVRSSSAYVRSEQQKWFTTHYRLSRPNPKVLGIWRQYPPVAQGWLTAQEAVTYVDLFFENMRPHSIILDSAYADHSKHFDLVTKEHVLCSTILMLSSRYHLLNVQGAITRGFYLHDKLWKYCQSLFNQVSWGLSESHCGSLRSLGTIESFLLVTDWHPRCFHFNFDFPKSASDPKGRVGSEVSGDYLADPWHSNVISRLKLSNKMSWMSYGSALSLSHELGLFSGMSAREPGVIEDNAHSYERKDRLRKLLFLYINELVSITGTITPKTPFHTSMQATIGPEYQSTHTGPGIRLGPWIELARLRRSSSEILFSSSATTQSLLDSGGYGELLQHFKTQLDQWKSKFSHLLTISDTPVHVQVELLRIEYEYTRVCINSLAVQAIASAKVDTPSTVSATQFELNLPDQACLEELVEGCKSVLESALKLARLDSFKFVTVRTHTHVATASMYLIKALHVLGLRPGAPRQDTMLDLLDQIAQVFRTNTADDMHMGISFGSLLTQHIRTLTPQPRHALATKISGERDFDIMYGAEIEAVLQNNSEKTTESSVDVNAQLDTLAPPNLDPEVGGKGPGTQNFLDQILSASMQDWMAYGIQPNFSEPSQDWNMMDIF